MHSDKQQRRDTFLECAEDYSAARPEYPDVLIDNAVSLARLDVGASLLEVGCGTGQATVGLQREDSALSRWTGVPTWCDWPTSPCIGIRTSNVGVKTSSCLSPRRHMTALFSPRPNHWLDPLTRVARCASHLKPQGTLIILRHTHPLPYTGFFERVEQVYDEYVPEWPAPSSTSTAEEQILSIVTELEGSVFFARIERRSLAWSRSYSTSEYQRLLVTYSHHAVLPPDRRFALLGAVGALIDNEFGGTVTRPYCTELLCARRTQE